MPATLTLSQIQAYRSQGLGIHNYVQFNVDTMQAMQTALINGLVCCHTNANAYFTPSGCTLSEIVCCTLSKFKSDHNLIKNLQFGHLGGNQGKTFPSEKGNVCTHQCACIHACMQTWVC